MFYLNTKCSSVVQQTYIYIVNVIIILLLLCSIENMVLHDSCISIVNIDTLTEKWKQFGITQYQIGKHICTISISILGLLILLSLITLCLLAHGMTALEKHYLLINMFSLCTIQ